MLKIKIFVISILLTTFFSTQTRAEGWTKQSGKGFYSLEYRFLSGNKFHNNLGENIVIPKLTDAALNFYPEFGITNDLTALINFPFYKMLKSDMPYRADDITKNSGIGDLDFGFRYRLAVINQTTISTSILLGVPISKDTFDKNIFLPLGDGEFNQIIGMEVGHSLYPISAYISGSIKYNRRSNGYSHQLYYVVESGYEVINKLLLNLRLHALQSLHNGDNSNLKHSFIFANDQQFLAYKIGTQYTLSKNIGISASFESGIIAYNIQSAPVFSIGIYFNN